MKKSNSSTQWLKAHESDEFVLRARKEGYRSRASYKLLEIDDKFRLIRAGSRIVDLGAAPGGWSQVVLNRLKGTGRLIALDLLPMDELDGMVFLQGDFTEQAVFDQVIDMLDGQADLVLSDMAPNMSGVKGIDQPKAAWLAELAVDFADQVLAPGGSLVTKCFEGEGINELRALFKSRFSKVANFKPRASRGKSREIYLVGCGLS